VPWVYGAALAVFATVILASVVVVGRRSGLLSTPPSNGRPTSVWRDGAAGVLSLTAYLLILFAYSLAPSPWSRHSRESGIVIAAGWERSVSADLPAGARQPADRRRGAGRPGAVLPRSVALTGIRIWPRRSRPP
jgi:hypothetical protein